MNFDNQSHNIGKQKPTSGVYNQQPPSIDNQKLDILTSEYKDSTVEKTEETGFMSTKSREFLNFKSYI